jgi:hypothetical protein
MGKGLVKAAGLIGKIDKQSEKQSLKWDNGVKAQSPKTIYNTAKNDD